MGVQIISRFRKTSGDSKTTSKIGSMAAIASSPIIHVGGGGAVDAGLKMATDCEVIDYTINNLKSNNDNNNTNNSKNNCDSRNSDYDRQQYGGLYGGRLQFFKDGKFILELARSKDGERSGWVSVPRKPMRPPSATSSTITPTSATSLVAYPKNESSTSLSFSDDNSSIQSSPWQRDHCWKQATPKRNVSKEMSLFFVRSNEAQLTQAALKIARRKRRQPLNKLTMTLGVKILERLDISDAYVEKSSMEVDEKKEEQVVQQESEKSPKTDAVYSEQSSPKDLNNISLEQSDNNNIKMEVIEEKNVYEQTDIEKSNKTIITKTDNEHRKNDEVNSNGTADTKTSESSAQKEFDVEKSTAATEVNDDIGNNKDKENEIKIVTETENKLVEKAKTRRNVKRKRLKVFKQRAKLDTIVQKLNQQVLRATEQQLKLNTTTTLPGEVTGNGLPKSSGSTQKIFPAPSASSAAATRLVDFHHQHVSPRKRILRELEKVSLEDAGAKRSRAKIGNNTFSLSTANSSSPTRIQTKLPTTTAMDISNEKTTTTTTTTSSTTDSNTTPTTTRLYSSYSIHSLLSGSSSSSNNNNNSNNKKHTITYEQQRNQHHVDNYQRNIMLGSPKSPELAKLYKKRSPPYTASPLREAHVHSPTSENSHHQQHMQHHTHLPAEHHQGFHSPYMLSPKYMPRPNAVSEATTMATTNYNNIPKNVSTPSNTYTSQHTTNASAFTAAVNLLSPQTSTASVESTPRTVPKKTQSIRRQFASPTTLTSSSPTTAAAATTTTALNENDMYMPHNNLQQHWPPVSNAPTMHTPLHFYMYPPAPPPTNGSSATDAAVAAAAAAAYIPYYHPYFTTLAAMRQNPLWLHHYAGHHASAANLAAASTRLSPPTPPNYAGSSGFLGATSNPPNISAYMPSPNSRTILGNSKLYGGGGVSAKTSEHLNYNNKLANPTTTTAGTVSASKHKIPTPTSTSSSHGGDSYKSGSIKDEPSSGM